MILIKYSIYLFFVLTVGISSQTLEERYKELINSVSPKKSSVNSLKLSSILSAETKKINRLKKNTFESTHEFKIRKENAIKALKEKIEKYTTKDSNYYQAGKANMISYDADREIMKLSLEFNEELTVLISEIKYFKYITLFIKREEARRLFRKNKRSFYITFDLLNFKLYISTIFLSDQNKKYFFSNPIIKIKNLKWIDIAKNSKINWNEAISYCHNLSFLGYSNWRLPKKEELVNLYKEKDKLTHIKNYYWSSTQHNNNYAWNIDFSNGYQYSRHKGQNLYVRCVQ